LDGGDEFDFVHLSERKKMGACLRRD
jgi:hypothetical protein